MSLPVGGLGSLAGYAMSDSDDEAGDMHKLTGNISGSDDEGSSHSNVPSRNYSPVISNADEPPTKKKAAVSGLGLVSYGGHDEESDQEAKNSDVEEEKDSPHSTQNEQVDEESSADRLNEASAEASVDSQEEADEFDVVIPPSPPGSPPPSLKQKIAKMAERRMNIDATIQSNKSFKNPSIYEKLLSHLGVDEKGTNYPPELFDPSIWDLKVSGYDALAKLQNIEMEKRKDAKKDRVKVDFITATKPSSGDSGEANRKSKWDTGASSQQSKSATANPVGSLIKK